MAIRQARRDANDLLEEAEKDREISEDELEKGLEKVQTLTDKQIKAADEVIGKKEKEIMEG